MLEDYEFERSQRLPAMSDKSRANILIVDDHPGKILTYEAVLRELNENLVTANSAREAFDHLLKNEFAVILVDVCMPELDGYQFATMIREHPRFEKTPIIFISAIYVSDLDRLRGYESGAVDYVPVPVVPELLQAKVKIFVDLYRKTRDLQRLNQELEHRVAERTAELVSLSEARSLLASIVDSSDDAIVSKDLDGVIVSWNRGAERLFGYSAEQAVGKPITILIPPELQDEEPKILGRIRRGERIDHYETTRLRKDGSKIHVSLTVSPVKNAEGRITGASKIARDITERRRAEEQQVLLLREMNHRIKNLFTVAGSIVALSARSAATPEALAKSVQERLGALARAQALTLSAQPGDPWQRPQATTLHALIRTILSPFSANAELPHLRVTGPDIPIASTSLTGFALLLHEFATNAAKYGALSVPAGRIDIECAEEGGLFILTWKEYGGSAAGHQGEEEEGFGSVLVRATAERQLGGEIVREWKPEGLTLRLTFARDRLAGQQEMSCERDHSSGTATAA
jgi:PAS domain S-box-containing protein